MTERFTSVHILTAFVTHMYNNSRIDPTEYDGLITAFWEYTLAIYVEQGSLLETSHIIIAGTQYEIAVRAALRAELITINEASWLNDLPDKQQGLTVLQGKIWGKLEYCL